VGGAGSTGGEASVIEMSVLSGLSASSAPSRLRPR
jgi:hypothetical protein